MPKIDLSFVKIVTGDDTDPCIDTVSDADPNTVPSSMPSTVSNTVTTPSPMPSSVPIRKSKKIDQLHQLRERNENDKLYQLQ